MEGKLTITVVEAKLMRDTEAIGKMVNKIIFS